MSARAPARPAGWVTLAQAAGVAAAAALYAARDGLRAWRALGELPGDISNYLAAARSLASGASPYTVANFDYPPLPALLLLPLAGLDEAAARQVWFVVGHGAVIGAAALIWRLLGGGPGALLAVAAVWALAGTVAENLVLGQVSPLLLLLIAAAMWGLGRGRGTLSGAAVGAAAALKLWPVVLFGAHLAGRDRRALAAGAAALVLLLVLPWGGVFLLPRPHLPQTAGYWMGSPALLNLSLPAVALRLADPPEGRGPLPADWVRGNNPKALDLPPARRALGVGVAALTLLAGGFAVARRARRPFSPEDGPLVAAALVSLALAASPLAWYHYQLLALPGLALLAWRWRRRPLALAGLGLLLAGLTWTQVLGIGVYVGLYGWTAARPALLWGVTSLVPALSLMLFALLLRETA